MIEKPDDNDITADAGDKALTALLDIIKDPDSTPAAKVSAARAVLDRFHPKANAESKQRAADERAEALAEARCLIAEFADLKLAGACEPDALDSDGAPEPVDATAEPAAAS